ncbi:hypothetical protein [Aeromicrobium sp. Leaf291]|uniref:hypothetical protein n=1 Tax=Aeromicrobium sp. Leaf291 TaxID=1736325 RepID=UPI0006F5BA5B|nr:hypothetical protein [Aeromicrobium sp. Leaf291]KQP83775.1 hypothetical protein ASF35_01990 [Aeromicrobium sp. Leaf291]
MKEPIKPEDIREGDLIRWESEDEPDRANEYRAKGPVIKVPGRHYLLDRPTPAVDLPTDEALGWATVRAPHWTSDTVLLRHWEVEGSHLRCAVAPMYLVDHITAFTPAVAVPKAALDELRTGWAEAYRIGENLDDLFDNLTAAVRAFLAAVDAANGDPR